MWPSRAALTTGADNAHQFNRNITAGFEALFTGIPSPSPRFLEALAYQGRDDWLWREHITEVPASLPGTKDASFPEAGNKNQT